MSDPLPSGLVTFLLTDVEGSTRLWEREPAAASAALARHDALIERAVAAHGGVLVRPRGEGDSRFAVFARASDAAAAAAELPAALGAEPWPTAEPVRVRAALHTGEAELREGDYYGTAVNRCARLRAIAHGGQVLLSQATADLVRDAGFVLRDLGEQRLKDLSRPERVYQLVVPDAPGDFPPLRTLDRSPNNLPVQLTPLVGREREVAEAVALLARDDVRLLTLTGPGGTGKTRLALQVAAELVDRMEDGAFFVDLAPLADPAFVLPTVAQTLGVREGGGRPLPELLCDHLGGKQVLLLLDNFEQVLEAATSLADLLIGCPRLKLLVTSRAVLRLRGEHDYAVPPLALPAASAGPAELADNEAMRLFLERARAAKTDFALTAENAAAVAEVCRRLDGLPLAIELAATRVRLLPPAALLARLEQTLPLLTGGARDLPARQRTLRDAIDWSYHLLVPAEQRLFRRLGVFAGGAALEAVEAVCDEPGGLERLTALEEQSLLRVAEQDDGEPRLAMLETLREYALDQLRALGEEAAVRRAHADHYLALAEAAAPRLTGADQPATLAALERDHDNLRAALRWCLDGDQRETAVRLGGALWRFWLLHGHFSEGRRWCDELLTSDGGVGAGHWAKLLRGAGVLAFYQGDLRRAARVCGESLSLYRQLDDKAGAAAAIHTLAQVARNGGDYAASAAMFEESLALAREAGDPRGIADAAGYLAMVRYFQGDVEPARRGFEEALARWREMGDPWAVAQAHQACAWSMAAQGDLAAARALLEQTLPMFTGLGDRRGVGKVLWGLGDAALRGGDLATARARFVETLAELHAVGDRFTAAWTLERLAAVAVAAGEPRRATALLGAAQVLRDATGTPTPPITRAERAAALASARATLDPGEFATEWDRGRAMSPVEAAAYQPEERGQASPPGPDALARASPPGLAGPGPLSRGEGASGRERSPLTARESEVAALIARGLTNRQIADQLVVGMRTAETHVANALAKLGMATRAELAVWAAEQGLRSGPIANPRRPP